MCYDVNVVSFCHQRPCGNEATEHHEQQKAASSDSFSAAQGEKQVLRQAKKGICVCALLSEVNDVFLIRQMQTLMRMEHTLATATERLERTRSISNELQAQVTDPCVARFETIYHGRE